MGHNQSKTTSYILPTSFTAANMSYKVAGAMSKEAVRATWIVPEAYPLFVALGAGCTLCAFQCARCMFKNPDVTYWKSERKAGLQEDESAYKKGENFHNHAFRRHNGETTPLIMPWLN